MICNKCGKTVPDSNKFCLYCGNKLEIYSGAPAQNTEPDGFSMYKQSVSPTQTPVQYQQTEKLAPVAAAPAQQTVNTAPRVQAQTPAASETNIADAVNTLVYQMQSENRKNKFLLLVIGILITVIAVGVGAFFALGGPDLFAKEEETTAEETTAAQNQGVVQDENTTQPPASDIPTSQYPTTTDPSYTEPSTNGYTEPTEVPTSQHQPESYVKTSSGLTMPASDNYQGICKAYNKAVNDYRAYKGKVTMHKVENTQIGIVEIPAVAKPLEGVINSVISNFVMPIDETYVFENGEDVDEPYRLIGHKMIPFDRDAAVTIDDVTEAKIVENADGGYTITLQFPYEFSTYDGEFTYDMPYSHMTAMDTLNLETIDISPLEIFSAEMDYPGATVELTVDGKGRLVELRNILPIEGVCEGGMGFIKTEIGLEGSMDSIYEMTYEN